MFAIRGWTAAPLGVLLVAGAGDVVVFGPFGSRRRLIAAAPRQGQEAYIDAASGEVISRGRG